MKTKDSSAGGSQVSADRVLVLASTYPLDAEDTQPKFVALLCEELKAQGLDVTVLLPGAPGARSRECVNGIHIVRYRYFFRALETLAYGAGILENLRAAPWKFLLVPFFLLGQWLACVRLLRRESWSLLHAHWIIPQGAVALTARFFVRSKLPVMVTSHGGDLFAFKGRVGTAVKRWVLRNADVVTVVSAAMKSYISRDLEVPRDDINVISMGVDLKKTFTPGNGSERERNRLIYVGRLADKKGVAVLLEAIALLKGRYQDLRLAIVGDGALRSRLEQQARSLQIQDHVEFLGALPNKQVPALLRRSAISVVPSVVAADGDQEGLGLVAVEAMGCGCAVVASDLPAIHDVVKDRVTGLFADAGNPQVFADRISALLDDAALRRQVAQAGRDFVVNKFDWAVIGEAYASLMKELVSATSCES